jgi:DNA-binding transcriptional regulator YdaS (Cro superfamily)
VAGNKAGGKKTLETIIKRYGEDYFKIQGAKGGKVSHRETRPFYVDREHARRVGSIGGRVSKRGKADVVKSKA